MFRHKGDDSKPRAVVWFQKYIYIYIYHIQIQIHNIYIYIYSEVFPNVGLTEVFSEVLNETSRNCWRPWSDWRSPAADGSF